VKVFVDTSTLIALLDQDDRWHDEAALAFRHFASSAQLVTTNYVQLETVALARRRLGASAVQALTGAIFPAITTVWVDEQTHAAALAVHSAGGAASFVDEVSFAVMRHEHIETALAFDRDFELQGFRRAAAPPGQDRRVHEGAAPYGTELETSVLVSVAEISERAGRPINTVQSWRRRHPDFPAPVAQLAAGPIWHWPTIAEWIASRGKRGRASDHGSVGGG
jgi:predicted nucleic acid-binding protein